MNEILMRHINNGVVSLLQTLRAARAVTVPQELIVLAVLVLHVHVTIIILLTVLCIFSIVKMKFPARYNALVLTNKSVTHQRDLN